MNSASIHATVRPRAVLISTRKIESMKGYANSKGVRTGRTQRVAFTVETCPVETRLELPTAQVRLRRSKPQEHDAERATTCLAQAGPACARQVGIPDFRRKSGESWSGAQPRTLPPANPARSIPEILRIPGISGALRSGRRGRSRPGKAAFVRQQSVPKALRDHRPAKSGRYINRQPFGKRPTFAASTEAARSIRSSSRKPWTMPG